MLSRYRLMTSSQWRLYFALELLDHVCMMPSWEAVQWADRVVRTAASEGSPEAAARMCAALYVSSFHG
ncbi:MAG: hypothetical protein DI603_17965 [Roseateles depolymerans]|uniref:Uncharacterized protein n=1 Tax=Roseateles depolymerans TaxID=76731 RepID=A0A2W5DEH3_9BURK|nr:MAG: hypothetical protein DI603_17965 [Roseateles depolymerans]